MPGSHQAKTPGSLQAAKVRNQSVSRLFAIALEADNNFYSIMQQILNGEFPVYTTSMEYRDNKYYMVIKDWEDEL
jgi:hypothetical protein